MSYILILEKNPISEMPEDASTKHHLQRLNYIGMQTFIIDVQENNYFFLFQIK